MAVGAAAADAGGVAAAAITLEYTPTWIVASVCSVIVVISLLFERMLHRLGKVCDLISPSFPYRSQACESICNANYVSSTEATEEKQEHPVRGPPQDPERSVTLGTVLYHE
jgi:hypothetical protein